MFKTIFSKLIGIFVAILILGFSITGVMLYYFTGNFVLQDKVRMLNKSGDVINKFITEDAQGLDQEMAMSTLKYLLKFYRLNTNSYIWVIDKDGYIVVTEASDPRLYIPDLILKNMKIESGRVRLPDEKQYTKVMQGQEVIEKWGDFYGLFRDTKVPWLTIEKPVKYKGKVIAAICLNTEIPEIQKVRTTFFRYFFISVTVSVIVSAVLIYILSLMISRPLKKISSAAKEISDGKFYKRLDIRSNDEIGELASSFNQMVVALENLEEKRRGFIANVSHELRTPMTSIRGFIEGILDGTIPPEKHKDYLNIVRDETQRLNRLVNDLLDLARMESGEVRLTIKNFDINELIRISIIKLENQIVQKGIEIEAKFKEEELFVSADSDAIERVVINLLHNAIKFSHENGKIDITTATQKDKVIVSIQDYGIGIDPKDIDLIWERFYKTDKSRSKDKTGTGLGLAIIKNIINEHGQRVWVESEPGKGSKFSFTLDRIREISE